MEVKTSTLRKLEIIIRPGKLDAVKQALKEAGYSGLTVSHAEGHGNQKGLVQGAQQGGGGGYRMEMVPKVRMEIVVADSDVDKIIRAVMDTARTGQVGDGKIFFSSVERVIRIRTGETGESAL